MGVRRKILETTPEFVEALKAMQMALRAQNRVAHIRRTVGDDAMVFSNAYGSMIATLHRRMRNAAKTKADVKFAVTFRPDSSRPDDRLQSAIRYRKTP